MKTHEEACQDQTIDNMTLQQVRKLVGFVELCPEYAREEIIKGKKKITKVKNTWQVTGRIGMYEFEYHNEHLAFIYAQNEQILELLLRKKK